MKKLLSSSSLPIATLELAKSIARKISFLSFSLILLLMGMVNQQTKAQVMYYLGSDGTYNTYGTTDAIYRVNQDGSDKVRLVTGVSSPQEMVIDLPNNRAFVTSWSQSSATTTTPHGLYRIDLSTGAAVKMLATSDAFRIANLAYDPVNDYLYYTANDGNAATTATADGLYRIKGDGSGNITLAAGISPTPTFLGIDIPNNKVYIYESVVTAPKLLTYTLSGNTATLSATRTAARYNGMDFDPVNNWLYFTSDNGTQDLTAEDALWRMRPNGTEATKIIANLSPNPGFVTVERVNNVAFVWNSTAGDRRIVKVNIANGTSSAFAITPAFSLQNQATALVIPAAAKIATLSSLAINPGTLSPAFSTANATYTTNFANNVTSVTVTPTKTHPLATINVNGTPVTSGTASGNIALNVGPNVINTLVTAEDGITSITYTLTATRRTSPTIATSAATNVTPTSAKLSGNISADGYGTITEKGIVYATHSAPTTADIKLNSTTTGTGTVSFDPANLTTGATYYARAYAINVDGTFYGNEITFNTASDNSNLAAYTISSGTLSPVFAKGTTNYTVSLPNTTSTLTITPTLDERNAAIKVNGVAVNSGSASSDISLNAGSNTINTVVTAQDGTTTKTYTLTVTRRESPTLTISAVTGISSAGATLGGNISADGYGTLTDKGIVIATHSNPTVSDTKISSGAGIGTVSSIQSALSDGTTYYVRTYAINLDGTFYSNEVSFTTKYRLDKVGLPSTTISAAAYSLRLLSTKYSGKAINVRRGDNNATQDIGFTSAGDLDVAALQTFVGGATAYITKWYDQSGNGYDLKQTDPSLQPRIANAGTVERLNGKPAVYFGTSHLATDKLVIYPTATSIVGFAKGNSTTPSAFITKTGTAAGANTHFPAPFDITNNAGEFYTGNASTTSGSAINAKNNNPRFDISSAVAASVYSFIIPSSGSYEAYLNGTKVASSGIAAYQDGGNNLMMGNRTSLGSAGNMWSPEVITFNSVLSSTDRQALEASEKSYFGNPDASLTGLALNSGTLAPAFTAATLAYTASVPYETSVIKVTPSRTLAGGVITVNNVTVAAGAASADIALNLGDNTITIAITAEDGSTTKNYTIIVTRAKTVQTISFAATASKVYGDVDYAISATTNSSLALIYTSDNTEVATIVDNKIHVIKPGIANITATQAGDATYAPATAVQALTVNKRPFTIKPVNATKVFGDPDPYFGGYAAEGTSLAPGDASTGGFSRVAGENVGIYATTQGAKRIVNASTSAFVDDYYEITFIPSSFTITPKQINVIANAATKSYTDPDPVFTYAAQSDITDATFTGSLSRTAGEEIGEYAITQGNLQINSNYTFNFVSANLTIGPKNLILTPNAASKVYGNADPAYTYTTNAPIVGNSTFTGVPTRAEGSNVGSYAITGLGTLALDNPKYTLSMGTGGELTITKRPLIFHPVPATKVYGNADPSLPYRFENGTSVAPNEGITGIFGRVAGEDIGKYTFTLGTKRPVNINTGASTVENYDISFITDTLTITQRQVTIFASAISKTFGQADPALTTYIQGSLRDGDELTGSLTRAPGENVGTYPITQGTLTLGTNYTITFTGNDFTIGQKTINVTANAKTKTYGAVDPMLDYTADALAFGDSFSGSLSRVNGESIGNHAIQQGTLALGSNYSIAYHSADLTINKAPLTYVATPVSRPIGLTNPIFTGTLTGFVNGENAETATTGTMFFNSTAAINSPIGTYEINGSGLNATNYTFVQAAGNASALTVYASSDNTLANLTVSQGTLSPMFSASVTDYSVTVANEVTSINVAATINNQYATVLINGQLYNSGDSKSISLNAGPNEIIIVVTAQDETTRTYKINAYRAYSSNNLLSSLVIPGVTFTPVFDPNVTVYHASVANAVQTIDIYGVAVDSTATVLGNNGAPNSATNPFTQALSVGEYGYSIQVTAQNGSTKQYSVIINRAESSDARLTSFGNGTITLNTPIIDGLLNYTATVAHEVSALYFIPVAAESRSSILVNGQPINRFSGNYLPIGFGENVLNVAITAADSSTTLTYVLNITRTKSADANLGSILTPFHTTVNEPSDPNVYNYTAFLADSTLTGIPLRALTASEFATLKINGTTVARGSDYFMAIHGGSNVFKIDITSQDLTETKTYIFTLTRAGQAPPLYSPIARLTSLSVSSPPSFSKNFNLAYETLETITAPNSVASIRFFLNKEHPGSTITLNGMSWDETNNAEGLYPIIVGDNLFTVIVTAENGVVTKTYEVHVNRLPYVNVDLASLTINKGIFTPAFSPSVTTYNLTVPYSVTQLTVAPVAAVNTATIGVTGALDVTPANPTATVNLNVGSPNMIRMTVRAADGLNTKTYTLNVIRLAPFAKLSNITLSAGTLNSPFDPENESYTATVPSDLSEIRITPTAIIGSAATITINGDTIASGSQSGLIPLVYPNTMVTVIVNIANGSTKTYTINVKKAVSNVTSLSSISFSPKTPWTRAPGASTSTFATSVDFSATSIMINATTVDSNATIAINGDAVMSGLLSQPIPLTGSSTIIPIVVTAQDGITQRTFTVTVNKTGSSNASLSLISFSPMASWTRAPGASSNTFDVSVGPDETSIMIKALTDDANATMTINGSHLANGIFSQPIPLTGISTAILITITAQDGITKRTFTVTVNKTGSTTLSSISFSPRASWTRVPGASSSTFDVSVGFDQTSIMIKALTDDANATMTINGSHLANGIFSPPVPLTGMSTAILITVTAQDGITKRTFTVTVNKTGSSNATLSSISFSPRASWTRAPGASSNTFDVSVGPDETSIMIKALTDDANATMTINGSHLANGIFSQPIPLTDPSTIIPIVVTAQDGTTKRTFTVTVNKTGSSNTSLSSISFSPRASWTRVPGASSSTFDVSVGFDQTSIMIKALTDDPNASMTINGSDLANGIFSPPVPLTGQSTAILITVTAPDGSTKRTFTITVNKSPETSSARSIQSGGGQLNADKMSITAAEENKTEMVVHQALSPNGDGNNDVLTIDGITAFPENTLIIMNRSGVVVFQAKGYDNYSKVFDGRSSKGEMQQPGTYFYTLEYKDGKQLKRKTGYIIIKY